MKDNLNIMPKDAIDEKFDRVKAAVIRIKKYIDRKESEGKRPIGVSRALGEILEIIK
jgi:hypothetical protein